jgi:integrative and conjugative element protein (TIGR02256 family)
MNREIKFLQLVAGEAISPERLAVPRARQLASFLSSEAVLYSELRSAFRMDGNREAVVFDVEAEVGQSPLADILPRERVAAVFDPADDHFPEVLALRANFPHVPHLNLRLEEFPRSLCLYEQSWQEVRVRWTAASFVERIREWLSRTSEGRLHTEDQPLEPLLIGPVEQLVIPSDLFVSPQSAEKLIVYRHGADPRGGVYTARRPGAVPATLPYALPQFVSTAFSCQPREHGIIRVQPRTIAELHNLVAEAGLDLVASLKERIASWQSDRQILSSLLIIIVFFPKTRNLNSAVEAIETWAFITARQVADIGISLGIFGSHNGVVVPVIGVAAAADSTIQSMGNDIPISVLNPTPALSRGVAARLNGLQFEKATAITAIGIGALGSQLIPLLVRSGYGKWTLIDDDVLLPHNVARHELTADAVGFRKAEATSMWLNTILEERDVARSISANVLTPGEKADEVDSVLRESEIIVDLSASLAVSRALATAERWPGRRISLFLNPSGSDLVLLAEDIKRNLTLDFLEMVYYREVVRNSQLALHLHNPSGPIRYAQSCRDLTRVVPGELVAMHAAIGSRALRDAIDNDDPSIRIWLAAPDLSVSSISISCPEPLRIPCGEWTLISDDYVLAKISSMRAGRLPNETGGVLIGHFDVERRAVYVVDALGSPPDSKEWPTVYIRGAEGLSDAVTDIQRRTGTMLQYVGEWHSHPDGYSCAPSSDDKRAFAWLVGLMEMDGYPGLMLIAGGDAHAWYLGAME